MVKIFVYGTLLEGCRNYERFLKGHVFSIQPAFVKGSLYSIKYQDYPALIDGDQMIHGEIMEIDEHLLPVLDQLEGYYGKNDPMNEYNKKIVPIYDKNECKMDCLPVYFYNLDHPNQSDSLEAIITSNDYRKWIHSSHTS